MVNFKDFAIAAGLFLTFSSTLTAFPGNHHVFHRIHVPTKIKTIYHTKIIKVPEHHHYIHEKEKIVEVPEEHLGYHGDREDDEGYEDEFEPNKSYYGYASKSGSELVNAYRKPLVHRAAKIGHSAEPTVFPKLTTVRENLSLTYKKPARSKRLRKIRRKN